MGDLEATLLLGSDGAAWHEWLRENRRGKDLILLDPADAHYGPAARLWLIRGDKPARSYFFGSLDAQRAPHILLAAYSELANEAAAGAFVQLFAYRASPLLRQLAQIFAFLIRPQRIIIAQGTPIDHDGWPIGPEEIELPSGLPAVVVQAQRKAQWLKMIERSQLHEIPLSRTSIQGSRLGSGQPLGDTVQKRAGLEHAVHAEVCGSTLFIVTNEELDEDQMSRALDVTHVAKAHIVKPGDYSNLLCAFVRPSGDTFGLGRVERIDFENGMIRVQADAVPPVPVPILRLGSLRVDENGRELGESRPWNL